MMFINLLMIDVDLLDFYVVLLDYVIYVDWLKKI